MKTEHSMPTSFTRKAIEAFHALQERFKPGRVAPEIVQHGHDPRWRAQQAERGERERALFQLRALGWPSA